MECSIPNCKNKPSYYYEIGSAYTEKRRRLCAGHLIELDYQYERMKDETHHKCNC
jgi:hypothetical protein